MPRLFRNRSELAGRLPRLDSQRLECPRGWATAGSRRSRNEATRAVEANTGVFVPEANEPFRWEPPDLPTAWTWDLDQLQAWQLRALNGLLATILPTNRFYQQKFGCSELQLACLDDLQDLALTTKEELVASAQSSPDGISLHHTYARSAYSRLHRTSGTTGNPLMVLETAADWERWSWVWQNVLEAAEIRPSDRVFLAFSFGPFVGFWSAHQACVDRGAEVIPGGGLSTLARLEFMRQAGANVICCTPSYAMHMAETAQAESFPIESLAVDRIIVAGESGGSIPAVRSRIENAWQAQVIDHSGATEIGPWGFGWRDRPGLHIAETAFIAEFLPIESGSSPATANAGPMQELVLTSLSRFGAPVIRYRTGDAVLAERPQDGPCRFLWLPQGVLGRTDSMVTIRGVNVFPSSIDSIVRQQGGIAEYRVLITRDRQLDQLELAVEADEVSRDALVKALRIRLGLRVPVEVVPSGSLPRSEGKSCRWQDLRETRQSS